MGTILCEVVSAADDARCEKRLDRIDIAKFVFARSRIAKLSIVDAGGFVGACGNRKRDEYDDGE